MSGAWVRIIRMAIAWRIERDLAIKRADVAERERDAAVEANHQLSRTVREMDATNARLSHASASRDFKPHGRFSDREAAR